MEVGLVRMIPVTILGCGGVARHLITHILNTRSLYSAQGLHISVVAICDSKQAVFARGSTFSEISDATLKAIWSLKESGCSLSNITSQAHFEDEVLEGEQWNQRLNQILGSSTAMVLVDCTASEDTVHILDRAVTQGCCVVLANKKPLTSSLNYFDRIMSEPRRVRFESTVGAGLPVITCLSRFLASGDNVHRIVGALSGTLGYVMSELEKGLPFSEIVLSAKSLGYTEPDPRDDLCGMDVARKALILARCLGWRLDLADVEVESLFPAEFGPSMMSTEEFLSRALPQLDGAIANRLKLAESKGCVLRYTAIVEGGRCKVGIVEIQNNAPLGRLKGSDNLIEIHSRCYKASPFVIQGAGAGNDTTAAGVLADILDLQDLFRK